ncbi:hypothetical protein TNCV_2976081 [Trichonephila clavipes]|nr:hypothetical protein TNCV_2976081 [Trichonephila clavipes]
MTDYASLESRARVLVLIKIYHKEGMMHIQFVKAHSPHVGVVVKFEFQLGCSLQHLIMVQDYEVGHQLRNDNKQSIGKNTS